MEKLFRELCPDMSMLLLSDIPVQRDTLYSYPGEDKSPLPTTLIVVAYCLWCTVDNFSI